MSTLGTEARVAFAIARKDAVAELRGRHAAVSTLFFAAVVLLLFGFALGPDAARLAAAAPGLLWLAVVFAGILAVSRLHLLETDDAALEQLALYPVARRAIYAGKVLGGFAVMLVLGVVVLGAVGLLLAVLLALVGVDGVNPRSMIGVVPPFLIGAGIGFGAHRSGRLGLAAAGATCLLFLAGLAVILLTPGLQRRDFRGVAEVVGAPDDRRFVVAPTEGVPPLLGYLPGEVERIRGRNKGRVQEVVVVGRPRSGREALASVPAFELRGSERQGRYEVSVFRASRPRPVAPAEIEEGPGSLAVLEQQPAP